MKLAAEQLADLHEQGFLSVPTLVSPNEALRVRGILERLFERKAGSKEGAYGELIAAPDSGQAPNSPQIRLPVDYAPELHKSACFAEAFELAKQILGPDARFSGEVAILKRAAGGAPTPWHQDMAFKDPTFAYNEVTIWLAMQDSDENSGCLLFLPGSHRGDILDHRRPEERTAISLQCVGDFDASGAIAGAVALGGCTIHFPSTMHCSTPNASSAPRIAYSITFGLPPRLVDTTAVYAWREKDTTEMDAQRRRWLRRGGVFLAAWRHMRRGELRSWRALAFWCIRATRTFRRGV